MILKMLLASSVIAILIMTPLKEPDVEWIPCRCNDLSLGLSAGDYTKHQMWLAAVRNSCFTKDGEGLPPRDEYLGGSLLHPSLDYS